MSASPGRKAFLSHLAAYVVVNAALLALNAGQTPEAGETHTWWAIWPLVGWGIGIAAHGFAEWAESHSNEGQLLADPDIRGVAVHLIIYLAVNALLIALNLTSSPENLWSIWPLLGWGVGLAAHAWFAYRAVLRRTMEHYATEQRVLSQMQLEAQAAGIAAAIQQPEKKKAPVTRKRRKQATPKTTKKRAARRGTVTKARSRKKPAGKKR